MLVLASSSPRRIQMLRDLGLRFSIVRPIADETVRAGERPESVVKRLALEKAVSVLAHNKKSALILAADTLVVAPGGRDILGKPANHKDAVRMLSLLRGQWHTVWTGYAILDSHGIKVTQKVIRVVHSRVKMRHLSRAQIEAYLRTGESWDKAGAYAVQDCGAALIEEVRGSFTNVIGLPLAEVLFDLERVFKVKLFSWKQKKSATVTKK